MVTGLGVWALSLALPGCTRAAQEKAAEDARAAVNAYCVERQRLLDSLDAPGEAGDSGR